MKTLAIDFGKKRIGLAFGEVIPKPLPVLANDDLAIVNIEKIIRENDIERIVVGMPYRSQGEEGTTADSIKQFSSELSKRVKIEIVFEPEQYTTTEAYDYAKRQGLKNTDPIDSYAAAILLEQFLSGRNESIN